MAFFNPLSKAFGLDIGDRGFKLVQLDKVLHSKRPYRLRAWGSVNVPEGVMERGEIVKMSEAAACLVKLLKEARGRLKGRAVVACLPEAKSFVKIIDVDKNTSEKELRQAVLREIEQTIPLGIDEIYYDWQLVEEPAPPAKSKPVEKQESEAKPAAPATAETTASEKTQPEAAPETAPATAAETEAAEEAQADEAAIQAAIEARRNRRRVLLAAAPKSLVDSYTQMLEMAGLAPIAFEVEAAAIARSVIPATEELSDAVGILDVGATRSSLVVFDENMIQMSISIPLSGNELTQIISEKLNVSWSDAELIKVECGLDAHRCEDRMWRILLPLVDDMSGKIRNALRFYKIGFPLGKKIERLYLCGGGAHFRDIDSVLSRKLTIKVRRGDSLVNVHRVPRGFPSDQTLTYATAVGLGLRAADESESFRKSFRL